MTTLLLDTATGRRTPTDLILSGSLVVAPILYLVVDSMYAARGWDDPDAGGLHVLAAIAYAFVLLRITTWASGWRAAATLVTGVVGAIGNAAYGFNTIHVSLGAVDLVDTSGPGAIIKPLGLFFPLSLLVAGFVLLSLGRRLTSLLLGLAAMTWPVAHIADIGWLAVIVNLVLVVALVPLTRLSGTTGVERLAREP